MTEAVDTLKKTALHGLHGELGAKMVPFAGYEMPIQYPMGILKEHLHTRAKAGLFDVSHMGQVRLQGAGVAAALEALVPGDIQGLKPGRTRYTLFTNDAGGIVDDLMVTKVNEETLLLVVNASRKHVDLALLADHLGASAVEYLEDRSLLALQGPDAAPVLGRLVPMAASLKFMEWAEASIAGIGVAIGRSGYTGEDGFEISVPASRAEDLARLLLSETEVAPIGLGARDTLRLEAGLCLYGQDIHETTTPIEAQLGWTIGKRRRGEANFRGAKVIMDQLEKGPPVKRVGIRPLGRAPAREHTAIVGGAGNRIGEITSGGFGPTANGPVAMGYVAAPEAGQGTAVQLIIRDKAQPAEVAELPFVAHRYVRG